MTKEPKIDLLEIGNEVAEFFYDKLNSESLACESVVNIKKWEDFLEKLFEKIKQDYEIFKTKDDLERVFVKLDLSRIKAFSGLDIGEKFAKPKGDLKFPCFAIIYSSECPDIYPKIEYVTFKSIVHLANHFKSIQFSKVQFEGEFSFNSELVKKSFLDIECSEEVNFYLSFQDCIFYKNQSFQNLFGSYRTIYFFRSTFKEDVNFSCSKLSNWNSFDEVKFEKNVYFQELRFLDPSILSRFDDESEKTLTNKISLKNSIFKRSAFFTQEKDNDSRVEIRFEGAVFEGPVVFDLKFLECPDFSEAHFLSSLQIKESWQVDEQKITEKDESKFRFLKKYFADQGNHFKEQQYFAYEMEAKRKRLLKEMKIPCLKNFPKKLQNLFPTFLGKFMLKIVSIKNYLKNFSDLILFILYKWTSNFGMSWFRPLFCLFISFCYFGYFFEKMNLANPYIKSFVRTFNLIFPLTSDVERFPLLMVTLTLQSLLNGCLIFLFILGLRNKFKIK